MQRRHFVKLGGLAVLPGFVGCVDEGADESPSRDPEQVYDEIYDQAEEVTYEDLMRTPESYDDEYVYLTGEIFQVVEEADDGFYLLVSVTKEDFHWTDNVLVYWPGERVLEDDLIEIYGVSRGLRSYEAALGHERTVPDVLAYDINLLDEADIGLEESAELLEADLVVEEMDFWEEVKVKGIVRNDGDVNLDTVTVNVILFDNMGRQIGTTMDTTSNLPPDEEWAFEALVHDNPDEIADWEIEVETMVVGV